MSSPARGNSDKGPKRFAPAAPNLVDVARLSALDASFLRVETPNAHMHVGWLSTLELPADVRALDVDALTERIEARLHLAPRFRQRVTPAPLGLGESLWSDDPDFDLRRHVISLSGEEPLGATMLQRVADAFFSEQLDRRHPLWSILAVPNLGAGRAAVLGKVHHAMVDGLAAVELGMVLFDLSADAELPPPVLWSPEPGPTSLRTVIESVADVGLEQFRAAGRAAALGVSPRRTLRVAETMRRAALSFAGDALRPAPPSYLNVPIGPRRTVAAHRMPIRRLLALKERCDVKLNDVVLAIAAGALRRIAMRCGQQPLDLRVMVPVSVRSADDASAAGNRITFAFIDLPVANADPLARLRLIRSQTLELKQSGRIEGSDLLLRSVALMPELLKERAARLAASPRLYNLTVSNVPGPRVPLYAGGARVASIYPIIPIPERHALSLGVLSYDGHVHFSAYADPQALPELTPISMLLEDSLVELELATRPPPATASLRGGRHGGGRRVTQRRTRMEPSLLPIRGGAN